MISAQVVADSISPEGHRLTTFKLRYPRIVHAEFMTHRAVSRNASGSRAVPNKKLREEAWRRDLRACPASFGRNQRGMQAGAELTGWRRALALAAWDLGARLAVLVAWLLDLSGAHKQVANRVLEPFTHINVVASATEWSNFFGLRLDAGADPTIRALARKMWVAMKHSAPRRLDPGEWHLPFVALDPAEDDSDARAIETYALHSDFSPAELAVRVSVARCARVSYESFETRRRSTVAEDVTLYEKLVGAHPLHASPAEHQATPDAFRAITLAKNADPISGQRDFVDGGWRKPSLHGNFVGWCQYRKTLPGESCAPLPEGYA